MAIIRERQLSEIWRDQRFDTSALRTEDGQPVTIIYPGRLNDDRGGDFCDAVISYSDKTVFGDVELHVRPGDWRGHGHHRDPSYNNVILHVVYSHGDQVSTSLEDGKKVPVLALGDCAFSRESETQDGSPCSSQSRPCANLMSKCGKTVLAFIDECGDARFADKSAFYERELASISAEQVLYQGIMTALGYSRNKLPFLELSRRLPLESLSTLACSRHSDERARLNIEQALMEKAGLLAPASLDAEADTSQTPPPVRFGLEGNTMSPGDWNSFHARPSNSPRVRIAAMACLVVRFRAQGLLQGLLQVVAAQDCDEPFSMERALTVVPSHASPGILGRSRARDIVINVLLPFSHAFGNRTNAPDLSARALRLYRKHPREDSNCIERHMTAQLGLSRGMVDSARRQQGLLHIFSSLCRHGSCRVCRLGEPEAGHNVQVQPIPVSGQ